MPEEYNTSFGSTINKILNTDIFQLIWKKENIASIANVLTEVKNEQNNPPSTSDTLADMKIEENNTLPTTNIVEEIKTQEDNTPSTSYIVTMNTQEKPSSTTANNSEKTQIKQDLLMTGLSDYGFWSQKVKEEVTARKEPDPAFRRGRIWC